MGTTGSVGGQGCVAGGSGLDMVGLSSLSWRACLRAMTVGSL